MSKKAALIGFLVLCVAGLPSCSTNTQGDDASPVFLAASFDLLPATKCVNSGTLLQLNTTAVKNILKVPSVGTSQFLDVRLDDYVIEWFRVDGGTRVPATEVFAGNVIIPVGGSATLSNYPFMSISALSLSPLDQLFPFNGGIDRETGRTEIRMKAKVTFRGHTLAGQPATGIGNFDMTFIYCPPVASIPSRFDDARSVAKRGVSSLRSDLFLSGLAAIAIR